jgi:ADP-ribose pyrophosphatase YjhB (NUDIX family)
MTTILARPDLIQHRPAHTTAAMVILRDGKVLLVRQPKDAVAYPNMWDLPHGRVAAGDSVEDSLLATARAELGIEVTAFSLLAAGDDLIGESCWRRLVFRVAAFDGDIDVKGGNRRWYSEREFADVFQLNPLVTLVPVFAT